MRRDDLDELLMGYLDGELDEERRALVERRLAEDPAFRRELEEYRRLAEMTEEIDFIEPTETEWRAHWNHIYNRLERGAAWILLSLGALCFVLYGLWHLIRDFLLDPRRDLLLRLGTGAAAAGAAVLAVSVIRERLRLRRVDRYEEVEL